jgi:hypothetical protein
MLHETTRKWICRRVFVASCLAPTLLVVGAIGYYHRPWRTVAANRDLSEKLHATVTASQVWQPRPGVTVYRSIQLRDLRTATPLLVADRVRADRRGGVHAFRIGQVKLPETELASLVRLLETWLVKPVLAEIHLQVDQLVWPRLQTGYQAKGTQRTDNALNLQNLQLHGEPDVDPQGQPTYRLRVQAEYRSNGQVVPLRLMVDRQIVERRPLLQVTLDLAQGAVPGWILHGLVPGGRAFQEARYCGVIRLQTDLRHVHGKLRGQLVGQPLQQLLPRDSRHQWSGEATIDWDHLTWQDGRVEEAQGLLHATGGTASRSLVTDAARLLSCQLAAPLGSAALVEFDEVSCRFQLQAGGLTTWGDCKLGPLGTASPSSASHQTISRCLLARRGKPLLWQSPYIVPLAQLVRLATTPTHSWTLPATRDAQRMAQVLPLPGTSEAAEEDQIQ